MPKCRVCEILTKCDKFDKRWNTGRRAAESVPTGSIDRNFVRPVLLRYWISLAASFFFANIKSVPANIHVYYVIVCSSWILARFLASFCKCEFDIGPFQFLEINHRSFIIMCCFCSTPSTEGVESTRGNYICLFVQGGFFYWSALKMTKCQTFRKFWHLELFDGIYYVIWHLVIF